jgi:spore coat protein U-like protein
MIRKLSLALCLSAAAFIGHSQAFAAGTANSTFATKAQIVSTCTMSVADLDFGTYDPFAAAAKTGSTDVTVTCTRGSDPVISLDSGGHFTAGQRAMITGAGGVGNQLVYDLFQPNTAGAAGVATSNPWGSGATAFDVGNATDKSARTVKLFGSISPGQDATVGVYADSVVATVNF